MSNTYTDVDRLVDALIGRIGPEIVLGLPIGIGKATHVADALYRRACRDPSLRLTIFTGLTLEVPEGHSDLERRFLAPLTERLYRDWPTPRYATALRGGKVPANVEIREFYLRPGAWLRNTGVQQSYTSANYSHVAQVLRDLNVNVVAQLVAPAPESATACSLGSNPEVTLDLLSPPGGRGSDTPIALVGQVNRAMPYMTGAAELPAARFDFLLDGAGYEFPLFGLPNRRVGDADYATAMHVASLVPDGGTLQLGIGSLSDAVAHCLGLRDRQPEVFEHVLSRLPGGPGTPGRERLPVETGPFRDGLFASSELLSDALYSLFERGILRRPAEPGDPAVVHAGFFIGSEALYARLRELGPADRERIRMCSIADVNTLHGDEARKRRQRRGARFVNETMLVTLLGAAVSDALDDGRVVSGVGGQFDFVAMAQALDDAQSILMCRARRDSAGRSSSNIRWEYAHTTVPRHYRDVFVTEYGIAATRGRSDAEVIESLLGVADAEFQPGLLAAARAAGKLPAGFALPAHAAANTPAALQRLFAEPDVRAHFPRYPLGTDLTETEQALAEALLWLQQVGAAPWRNARTLLQAVRRGRPARYGAALTRMGLNAPASLRERMTARLLAFALEKTST
ncbi:MAG: acetyl-CoA hydrolase/transferase C-terminal domain-containing protein [Pseudomonadota bacterium]